MKSTTRMQCALAGLALIATTLIAPAHEAAAQSPAHTYPNRPVRIIVPYLAGGPADTATRVVAQGLQERLGQPFVVDNRAGAGGNIGSELIAKAAPDGYTLGIGGNPTGGNVALYKTLPYDPLKSFATISVHYSDANILVVAPNSPIHSVAELIALAKKKPNELTFSSSGNGTSTHLSGALFNSLAGVQITHVPYKGVPPAITDVMGGQVTLMFASASIVSPYIKSGRLKGLAVTGTKRLPIFPDIPTVSEAGLPGFEAISWTGLMAPAGTPPEIIAKLHAGVVATLTSPQVRSSMEGQGFEVVAGTPAEMQEQIRSDIDKWGDLIRATGAKVD